MILGYLLSDYKNINKSNKFPVPHFCFVHWQIKSWTPPSFAQRTEHF